MFVKLVTVLAAAAVSAQAGIVGYGYGSAAYGLGYGYGVGYGHGLGYGGAIAAPVAKIATPYISSSYTTVSKAVPVVPKIASLAYGAGIAPLHGGLVGAAYAAPAYGYGAIGGYGGVLAPALHKAGIYGGLGAYGAYGAYGPIYKK